MDTTQNRAQAKRSRRQFSMRALLALMFLIALAMGFWITFIQPYRREARIIARLQENGVAVVTKTEGPAWLRRVMGDDFCRWITEVEISDPKTTAADLQSLAAAPRIVTLCLVEAPNISDSDLRHLAEMSNLSRVIVYGSDASDEGLRHLASVKQLEHLTLIGPFTEIGMRRLALLHELRSLALQSPHLTDESLAALSSLTSLHELQLTGNVTDAGMTHLRSLKNLERLVCDGAPWRGSMGQALDHHVVFEFQETPLRDAMEFFSDVYSLPIQLDRQALEDAGQSDMAPVTATHADFPDSRMRTVLDEILHPLKLDWTIADGEVFISTKDAIEQRTPGITALRKSLPNLKHLQVAW